jgi:hypothetical protein
MVAFVCHSPGALKNVKVNGEFLVKETYRFSNAEEAGRTDRCCSILLEDALQKMELHILQ